MIPKDYFSPEDAGTLRLLSEQEWRGIGITQSLGWEHYEVHGRCLEIVLIFSFLSLSQRPSPTYCFSDEPKTSFLPLNRLGVVEGHLQ